MKLAAPTPEQLNKAADELKLGETEYRLNWIPLGGYVKMLGQDDLKFMVTHGEGIGRYVALGTAADTVIDGTDIDRIGITAGYVAYKHQWTPKLRSTLTASTFSADNEIALTGGAVTKSVTSFSGNLLYSPVAKLSFGVEYRHAEREVESGADGSLDRLQFSTKYSF